MDQMNAAEKQSGGWRWTLLAVGAFVAALLIYQGAGWIAQARDAAQPARVATMPLVEVVSVRSVPQTHSVIEEGFLRPKAEIDVVAEVAGKVVDVSPNLAPGGRFAAGDVMFTIDPRTFEADLARAKADLSAARAEVARAKAEDTRQGRLQDIGAAAAARREQAGTELAAARARLGQAEAGLIVAQKAMADTAVTTPFAASVISESLALGRFVQPGQAVATIFDTSAGEVVLGLLPEEAREVRRALEQTDGPLRASVTPTKASAGDAPLEGIVKSIGQAVDQRSRTVPVVVEVPGAFDETNQGAVFANDFVRVELPAYSPEPLYAVTNDVIREERFIWTLTDDNRLHAVAIDQVQRRPSETLFRATEDLTGHRVVLTALTEEAEGIEVAIANPSGARAETLQ
ncbi:MAG: efflux RND transporter periplasmic adaptor subunit [Pseudomonadota bacterium]